MSSTIKFRQIAKQAASKEKEKNKWETLFFQAIQNLELIPQTPSQNTYKQLFSFVTNNTEELPYAITDSFIRAVIYDKHDWLQDDQGRRRQYVHARSMFESICKRGLQEGKLNLMFVNQPTNTQIIPRASINLSKMVRKGTVDWVKLGKTTKLAVRFLDNQVKKDRDRKIGVGYTGWANMLIELHVPYDSRDALDLAEELASFVKHSAEEASERLVTEKGSDNNRRNAQLLSITSDKEVSKITGTAPGIEPLPQMIEKKTLFGNVKIPKVHPLFENYARYQGFYSKELVNTVTEKGSIQGLKSVPKQLQSLFVTSKDISPEAQIRMQAVFQSHVDNAVSNTITLTNPSLGDIKRVCMVAWKNECKQISLKIM